MAAAFDLIVRGGTIVDGNGATPIEADVAIADGRIVAVGNISGRGREEFDAKGLLVTPGFVDIHTHYDGQVTWENRLVPSSSHGVTTVVMGNCGVGFAPCRPDEHDLLIRLMEGVEDIPHPVLVDGLPWTWETYPQYFDFLASRRYDMDICGYVPHAAVRIYAMGRRGADREPATREDLLQMARIVREAVEAGAMGFSTSRTFFHQSSDGKSTPSFEADERELMALADALREAGTGAMQLITDFDSPEATFGMLRRLVERSGRPLSVSLLEGAYGPMTLRWHELLDWAAKATEEGLPIKAQVLSRAIGVMLGTRADPQYVLHVSVVHRSGRPSVRRKNPRTPPARRASAHPCRVRRPGSDHRIGTPGTRVRSHVFAGRPTGLRAAVRTKHRIARKAPWRDTGSAGLRSDA